MKSPEYGWLIGLTNYMNKQFGKGWAYTGSFAMYCHAAVRNKPCREPADVDILTNGVSSVWTHLYSALNGDGRVPGVNTQKARLDDCNLLVVGESSSRTVTVSIDVLAEGEKFGFLKDVVEYNQQSTVLRVASLDALILRKRAILEQGLDVEKSKADIVTLTSLKG